MSPDRQRLRDEILEAVISAEPSERTTLLNRACGEDTELHDEIADLLRIQDLIHTGFLNGSRAPHNEALGFTVDRYVVEEIIGSGGMSDVYRALDSRIGRQVALKLITSAAGEAHGRKCFLSEVQALGCVSHPNIVRIYDCGEFAGRPFIVMELLKGVNLSEAIRNGSCGPLENKLTIARQLAATLGHIHSLGILHRDIKPANVFLENDGGIKLMDFGISRFLAGDATQSSTFTGTLHYMSPEQLRGEQATAGSEVYAWGILVYELFTGRRFFTADSVAEVIRCVLDQPLDVAPLVEAGVPAALIRLISDATSKDSRERPQSALELVARMDSPPPPADHVQRRRFALDKPFDRKPHLAAFGFATLIAAASIGAAFLPRNNPVSGPASIKTSIKSGTAVATHAPVKKELPASVLVPLPHRVFVPANPSHNDLPTGPSALAGNESAPRADPHGDVSAGNTAATVSPTLETTPAVTAASSPSLTPEQRDWNHIHDSQDISAVRGFLVSYPNGQYFAEARQIAAKLEYEKIRGAEHRPEVLAVFARDYPDHPFAPSALSIVRQIESRTEAAARIRATIAHYTDAFCGHRIDELSIYRELSKDQRKRIVEQFRDARKIELTIVPTRSPEFAEPILEDASAANNIPTAAVVQASQRVRIVAGDGTILPMNQLLTIHLRRTGSDWVITSL